VARHLISPPTCPLLPTIPPHSAPRDCRARQRYQQEKRRRISRTELIPSRKKAKTWTDDEDKVLKNFLVEVQGESGNQWTNMAQLLPGRSGETCGKKLKHWMSGLKKKLKIVEH